MFAYEHSERLSSPPYTHVYRLFVIYVYIWSETHRFICDVASYAIRQLLAASDRVPPRMDAGRWLHGRHVVSLHQLE